MKLPAQSSTVEALRAENAELRARLEEAGEMLRAIRAGEVDALVVEGDAGPQLYTLQGLDAEQNRIRGEMLAQVRDAVVAVDLDQRLVYLNAAAERQYGVRSSDVLGRPLEEVYTRRWPSNEAEAGKQVALRERGEWRGELIHCTVDGREIPVEVCVTLLRGVDGERTGVVAAIRDVTLRKKTEEERAEALRLLDTLLTRAPVGFVYLDRDLRFVRINERLAEMNGLSVAAHVGRLMAEILPSLDATLREVTARILATGQPVLDHEFAGVTDREPGVTRYWNESWYPVRDGRGEIIGFGGVVEEITERKRVEAALRHSERRFRSIFDSAFQFIGLMTPDGTLLEANRTALEAGGLLAENVIGKPFWECDWWTLTERTGRELRTAIGRAASGEMVRYDADVRGAEGRVVTIDFSIKPIRDGAGRVVLLLPEGRDITALKRTEEALRLTHKRLNLAVTCSRVVLFQQDLELRYTWLQNAPPGFGESVAIGKRDADLMERAADAAVIDALKREAIRSGVSQRQEVLMQIEGAVRHFDLLVEPQRDAAGLISGVTCAAIDITERKCAEEALKQSWERILMASEAAQLGYWSWQPDTDSVVWENEYPYRIIGVPLGSPPVTAARFVAEFLHPDDAPLFEQAVAGVVQAGKPFAFMGRIRRPDGEARWVEFTGKSDAREDGRAPRIIGTVQDITERKRAEEALRDNAVMLTDLDRRKDAFLATLSHELRNPLGVIASSLHLLRLGGQDPDAVQQGCARMQRQVVLLTRLIDDLMDVSRINQDKLTLRTERLDLATVARSAVENSRTVLDLRGHVVTVVLPPQPIEVDGDAERLGQVVSNLLTNAAKYSDPGTPITLTVERQGHVAAVVVRDRGIGIAPGDLGRVFELFAQVRGAAHLAQGGVGIGLNLVKRVIELHGGTVEARSGGLGRGSEFLLRLPLASARTRPESPPDDEVPAPAPPRRYRILVADDNEDAVTILALLLSQLGHEVRIANDGAQAVAVAAIFKPDVALLDIGMPELDGYEACRRIRAQPGGDAMVLVALSGWGRAEDKRRARSAGFQHHLVKPLDPADLTALLHSLAPALSDPAVDGRRSSVPMSIAGPG